MLRSAATKLQRMVTAPQRRHPHLSNTLASSMRTFSAVPVPTVADVTVNITFVDFEGNRQTVPARVGQTLHEVAEMYDIEVGPASVGGVYQRVNSDTWTETLFGEGATSGYDHVMLVGKGADTANMKCASEYEMLEDYWDSEDIAENSRLASMVEVNPAMEGMTVFIPDALPWEAP